MGYLTNFIVYMLAMVGVLVIAMMVFKHSTGVNAKGNGKCLKVLDTLSLGARKTLYIVSAGEEKFLIAGDTDRTTLISKLNSQGCEEKISAVMTAETEDFSTKTSANLPFKKDYTDRKVAGIHTVQKTPYEPVMKTLAERIRG